MIIHWNAKDAGPTSQIFGFLFNTFTSGPLSVISTVGAKKLKGFIINVGKLGLR